MVSAVGKRLGLAACFLLLGGAATADDAARVSVSPAVPAALASPPAQLPASVGHVHGAAAPGASVKKTAQLATSAVFDAQGRLWVAYARDGHVYVARSDDAGRSFAPERRVNEVPEAIAADGENRPKLAFATDGGVLVAWTRPLAKPYTGEIRFARAADGRNFAPPFTVHRDRAEITHRFESMVVAGDGRVVLAWIDKRDQEAAKARPGDYRGAAIYAATSLDGGRSFLPERKLADHSCECCRIAATLDADGAPLFMWRHVFAPNERDHAIVRLAADGAPETVVRATFERWKIDGCPHHGPSLAVDAEGTRHAVWFNQKDGVGRVFYGRLVAGRKAGEGAVEGQRPVGGPRAEHADLAVGGRRVLLVWREFDGEWTRLLAEVSEDGGRTFRRRELAVSAGPTDQPRALAGGGALYAFWRSAGEGMRLFPLAP